TDYKSKQKEKLTAKPDASEESTITYNTSTKPTESEKVAELGGGSESKGLIDHEDLGLMFDTYCVDTPTNPKPREKINDDESSEEESDLDQNKSHHKMGEVPEDMVESKIYTTKKNNETIGSIAERYSLHWKDIADINTFNGKTPFKKSKLLKGTEINLPCLRLNIVNVMAIIKSIEEEQIKQTNDPENPFGISETEILKHPTPKNFWDVMRHPHYMLWIAAIRKEMQGFNDNNVFLRTKRSEVPKDKPIIKVKEIYTHKCRAGWLQKYKYRHAARGDMLDVDQHGTTYWSSASSTTLKIFCAIAAETGCEPQVLDVNTAYLNAPELHEIYMEKASFADFINKEDHELETLREEILLLNEYEFKEFKKDYKNESKYDDVEKLLKSVYGVPSAGCSWGRHLKDVLKKIGLSQSIVDNSLYYKRTKSKFDTKDDWLLVCTITDDIPFNGSPTMKQWFLKEIRKVYEITHEPHFTGIIGLQTKWNQNDSSLEMLQTALINKIADAFEQYLPESGKYTKHTPLPEKLDMKPPSEITDDEFADVQDFPYASLVCSLGYLAEWSKPELLYARSYLSTYLRRYDSTRIQYALQALMYCITSKDRGTIFTGGRDAHGYLALYAFADASLMQEPGMLSRIARILKLGGACISAKTNKTTLKHMSSTGAEVDAACATALDVVGVRHLLQEIGIWYNTPVVIYEDNKPTIAIAHNESSIADAGRHMALRMFKIKELVENKTVVLKYIETSRQVADLLTKSLGRVAFERLRDDLTGYLAYEYPLGNIHTPEGLVHLKIMQILNCGSKQWKDIQNSIL
ncbi:MAG: hypothetical protein QMC37_01515, partial [Flavobacteriales bacterium]